ncbi:PQQ-binding-like beta-propeller repeat protein [Chloroflexota bacterium]
MKHYVSTLLTLALLFSIITLSISAIFVQAQLADSPWPMFRHDLQHTGRSPYNGPAYPEIKWVYNTGDWQISSSPVIDTDGTVYIGTYDSNLFAVSSNGSLKWVFNTSGSYINSTPAISSDGTIYFGTTSGGLFSINPDGTENWRFGVFFKSSPVIASDGTIYVGSSDGSPETEALYAINPNGTPKWSYILPVTGGSKMYSSPAIADNGTIYFGSWSDNKLSAVSSNGSLQWSSNSLGSGRIYSSPAIGADGTIYIGSTDKHLHAINPDGSIKWSFPTGDEVNSSPAIALDGTIYVGSDDNNLYAINPDGTEKWSYTTRARVSSSPVIGADGTVYVGSGESPAGYRDDSLYAISPDGTLKWKIKTGGSIWHSPAVAADGTIYVGANDGKVYAIGLDSTPPIINDIPKIAFVSDRDGDEEIYIMDTDGSGLTQLTNNSEVDRDPRWSPDGSKIAFWSQRDGNSEIYVMNSNGSNQTRLTNNEDMDIEPSWSPDGTKIVFSREMLGTANNKHIHVMNADGTNTTQLTQGATVNDRTPDWNPDGSKIAFSRTSPEYGVNSEICVMDADGSNITNITNSEYDDWGPRWSPDGTKIAFEYNGDAWTINTDGSNWDNRSADGLDLRQQNLGWSPDGLRLVYTLYSVPPLEVRRDIWWMSYYPIWPPYRTEQLTDSSSVDFRPDWGSISSMLVTPSNGETTTNTTPIFSWVGAYDQAGVTYDLQVDAVSDFSSPTINITDYSNNSYTPISELALGAYYWRIRAIDGLGNTSNWTSLWTFTIDDTPPNAGANNRTSMEVLF